MVFFHNSAIITILFVKIFYHVKFPIKKFKNLAGGKSFIFLLYKVFQHSGYKVSGEDNKWHSCAWLKMVSKMHGKNDTKHKKGSTRTDCFFIVHKQPRIKNKKRNNNHHKGKCSKLWLRQWCRLQISAHWKSNVLENTGRIPDFPQQLQQVPQHCSAFLRY